MKVELRAITKSCRTFESAVMISSVNPSLKYSCFGSSLIFSKGNTAIEGLSGNGSAGVSGSPAFLSESLIRSISAGSL